MFTSRLATWQYAVIGAILVLAVAFLAAVSRSHIEWPKAYGPPDTTQQLSFKRSDVL